MAPKKAGEKFREDQVFDIVTGYYPEIASSVHYKTRMGKGQTGIKHIRKRGFSNQTIERDRTRGLASGEGQTDPFSGHGTMTTKATAMGAEGTTMEGKNLWQRKVGTKKDKNKIWYKFTGGGDMYKLYGDQVWYMHGVRTKDALTDYVNSTQFGDRTPSFGNIYSRMEGALVEEARALASDIFDEAVAEVDNKLEKAKGSPMSAEEMGYKDGDFEYLSHADAIAKYPELEKQIRKVSGSMANPRDLYRIKNGQVELMQDVTEMPLEEVGQHGITHIPPELMAAIEEVKSGTPANLTKLKQGVANMYTKAIDKDYNPVIMEMKGHLIGSKGKGDAQWKNVLKAINNAAGKGGKTTTGTAEIAEALGVKLSKFGFMQTGNKKAKQTAIELVAHVLGTMNTRTNSAFRQSHRVYTYEPSGISVYATADLTPDPATFLFKTPVAKKSIGIIEGYNVTLAQERLSKEHQRDNGLSLSQNQKHAYSGTKVTGMACTGTSVSSCTATMGISKGLRPTTSIHIPALGELEKKLIEDLTEHGIPDISHRVGQEGSKLQQRMYGLGKRRKAMRKGEDPNTRQFWALPYIGVLQSEYIDK